MINIDLKTIGNYLSEKGLWRKSFSDLSESEITGLCEAILEATADDDGALVPYIDHNGGLVIPFRSPRHYRWWQGGQSVIETLIELGANQEIIKRYTPAGYKEGAKKE